MQLPVSSLLLSLRLVLNGKKETTDLFPKIPGVVLGVTVTDSIIFGRIEVPVIVTASVHWWSFTGFSMAVGFEGRHREQVKRKCWMIDALVSRNYELELQDF